jgi:hypothetical protein
MDPVIQWRYDHLLEAGFPPDEALRLAGDRDVDLHWACDACRETGHELAWEIFA